MFEEFRYKGDGMRLGWISLGMCIPFYVVNLVHSFELKWMTGFPFIFFYTWSLISMVSLPILIGIQIFFIGKLWFQSRALPIARIVFLILTTILYVYPTRGFWVRTLGLE